MKRIVNWALPLLLIGALTAQGLAQDVKWKDTKEYEDYRLVYDEKDHAKKAALAEKFYTEHKDADPIALTQMYTMMLLSYANAGNWAKTLETIEKQATLAPKISADEKKRDNQIGMAAAANSKNNAKTVEYADKVLTDDPKNFNALITLSGVLSQNLPAADPQKSTQIARVLEVTRQALALPKPPNAPDAQWNPIQVQLRETACLMLLNQNKHSDSITECQAALKINPKDGYAWYLIGLAHKASLIDLSKKYNDSVDKYNANRTADQFTIDDLRSQMQGAEKIASDKRDETVDAFAKAAAAPGTAQAEALKELRNIFPGTPEELNKLIEEKKSGN